MHQAIWNLFCRAVTAGSKIIISGQEHIPEGPKIFACNHPTSFDPCYVYRYTENAAIVMTQFIFDLPIAGRCVNGCGFIPVSIRDAKQNTMMMRGRKSAYGLALNTLMKGRSLLIAPEGKMSQDNHERKYHNGAARLSYVTGFPVVPIIIRQIGKIKEFHIKDQLVRYMPRGHTFIRFRPPYYVPDNDFDYHTQEIMEFPLVKT